MNNCWTLDKPNCNCLVTVECYFDQHVLLIGCTLKNPLLLSLNLVVFNTVISHNRIPVKSRITFKILHITFKCIRGLVPPYLSALLSPYCPTRSLRSSDQLYLKQPTSRTKIGERFFSSAARRSWNQVTLTVRQCTSVNQFKVALDTSFYILLF